MSRVRLTALALLALTVVVAGCSAPTAQSDPDSPGTGSITITNGTLEIDAETTFARLQTIRGTAVEPPAELRVLNDAAAFRNQSGETVQSSARFASLAGMNSSTVTESIDVTRQKNGYVTPLGSVVLFVGKNATTLEERLLVVHELTHYVQFKERYQEQLLSAGIDPTTTDGSFVVRSLVEGGAIVTTDAYLARFGNATDANSAMYRSVQSTLPDGHVRKYGNAKYVFGGEYMDSRTTEPADLSSVYENPPLTSEQVIHGLGPAEEPAVPLEVTVDPGSGWRAAGSDRMGEAFARFAVERWVGTDHAARAAAGWGNDTLHYLRPTNGSGETAYVWTLRWDDATNASEFVSAYRDALDARGSRDGGDWTLPRENVTVTVWTPTDRSTAIAFGPGSLVGNLTASGNDGDITVAAAPQ